jgi:hypothetical protein
MASQALLLFHTESRKRVIVPFHQLPGRTGGEEALTTAYLPVETDASATCSQNMSSDLYSTGSKTTILKSNN